MSTGYETLGLLWYQSSYGSGLQCIRYGVGGSICNLRYLFLTSIALKLQHTSTVQIPMQHGMSMISTQWNSYPFKEKY
jgi:hypothetical protein